MLKRRYLIPTLACIGIAGIAWGLVQFPPGDIDPLKVEVTTRHTEYSTTTEPTSADLLALNHATAAGLPPPSPFSILEDRGSVTGKITEVIAGPPQEFAISVVAIDDSADMNTAELQLGSTIVFRASRSAGSIIDRSGKARATMTALVPATPPVHVTVRWSSTTGLTSEQTLQLN